MGRLMLFLYCPFVELLFRLLATGFWARGYKISLPKVSKKGLLEPQSDGPKWEEFTLAVAASALDRDQTTQRLRQLLPTPA
jgi:hypothetical protein